MQNPSEKLIQEKLRQLPSVEKILESDKLKEKIEKYSHPLVAEAARETLSSLREQIKENPQDISHSPALSLHNEDPYQK